MAEVTTPTGKVVITPEQLAQSAATIRRELLQLPLLSLGAALKYFSIRTGIRFSETVGTLDGNFEMGPYNPDRVAKEQPTIKGRTLYTYFGDVVSQFDPNSVYQSIWGSSITKGEGLKNVPITQQVLSLMAGKVGRSLGLHLFDAVRNDTGSKTVDLFNGVDTVASKEITAGNISVAKGNLFEFPDVIDSTNAVDLIVEFCRAASDELLLCEDGDDSRGSGLNLYVPRSIVYAYRDDYKATTGNSPIYDKFNQTVIEGFPNIRLVPFAGKANAKLIELTTRNNMLIGVDQMGGVENVTVEKHHPFYLMFIMTMFFGFDFESIDKSRLFVGKLKEKTVIPPAGGGQSSGDNQEGDPEEGSQDWYV